MIWKWTARAPPPTPACAPATSCSALRRADEPRFRPATCSGCSSCAATATRVRETFVRLAARAEARVIRLLIAASSAVVRAGLEALVASSPECSSWARFRISRSRISARRGAGRGPAGRTAAPAPADRAATGDAAAWTAGGPASRGPRRAAARRLAAEILAAVEAAASGLAVRRSARSGALLAAAAPAPVRGAGTRADRARTARCCA